MQVTETAAAGLKREYRVVVPATDLEARVNERLDDLKGKVQLRGFRVGQRAGARQRVEPGPRATTWTLSSWLLGPGYSPARIPG